MNFEEADAIFGQLATGNATEEQQKRAAEIMRRKNQDLMELSGNIVALNEQGSSLQAKYDAAMEEGTALKAQYDSLMSDSEVQKYMTAKQQLNLPPNQPLPKLSTPAAAAISMLSEDNMDEDIVIASGTSAAASKPHIKRTDILNNTKMMRTAAKNLVQKLARLRTDSLNTMK